MLYGCQPHSKTLMRYRAGLVVLALVWLGLVVHNVRIEFQDRGWLLNVYESKIDIKGLAAEHWNRMHRWRLDCPTLQNVNEPIQNELLQAIYQHSPPDSLSATLLWVGRFNGWALAEVGFERLNPAVIVLQQDGEDWQVLKTGIWSGQTYPWRPSPFIRHFLSTRNAQAPQKLLHCWQAQHPIWNREH